MSNIGQISIQTNIPAALRAISRLFGPVRHAAMLSVANLCERDPSCSSAEAARQAAHEAIKEAQYSAAQHAAQAACHVAARAYDAAIHRELPEIAEIFARSSRAYLATVLCYAEAFRVQAMAYRAYAEAAKIASEAAARYAEHARTKDGFSSAVNQKILARSANALLANAIERAREAEAKAAQREQHL
jgi:hypothetical protein